MIKIISISFLILSCSIQKEMIIVDNTCSDGLLKAVQFNGLIEYGVKDSSVYNVVNLNAFFKTKDSIVAKQKWDSFIDATRFYEGQKTTLRTDYKNYHCECKKANDSIFIYLTHAEISVTTFKLVNENSFLKIVEVKTARL